MLISRSSNESMAREDVVMDLCVVQEMVLYQDISVLVRDYLGDVHFVVGDMLSTLLSIIPGFSFTSWSCNVLGSCTVVGGEVGHTVEDKGLSSHQLRLNMAKNMIKVIESGAGEAPSSSFGVDALSGFSSGPIQFSFRVILAEAPNHVMAEDKVDSQGVLEAITAGGMAGKRSFSVRIENGRVLRKSRGSHAGQHQSGASGAGSPEYRYPPPSDVMDVFDQAQGRMANLSTKLRYDPVEESPTSQNYSVKVCVTTGHGELLTCGDVESNPGPNTER